MSQAGINSLSSTPLPPAVPLQFTTDAGIAVPVANNLNVLGGTAVDTSGAGSTITIAFDSSEIPSIATTYNADAGSATPAANVLTIAGGTGLSSAGAGSTITINLDTPVTVANGGTGQVTLTDAAVLLGNGTGGVQSVGPLTNGQLVIGSTGVDPVAANLTEGTGIDITNAAGSITINASGMGMTWSVETTTTRAATVNTGTIANNAGLVTITLPATSAVGDTIAVTGINNATGWRIAQNAGNTIFFGASTTTPGVGGRLDSTATRDTVFLVCMTANATWNVVTSIGNITVV